MVLLYKGKWYFPEFFTKQNIIFHGKYVQTNALEISASWYNCKKVSYEFQTLMWNPTVEAKWCESHILSLDNEGEPKEFSKTLDQVLSKCIYHPNPIPYYTQPTAHYCPNPQPLTYGLLPNPKPLPSPLLPKHIFSPKIINKITSSTL